jgi:hypothetical protein
MAIQKKSMIGNLNATKKATATSNAPKGDASVVDKQVVSRAMLSKTIASRGAVLSKSSVSLSKSSGALSKIALSKNSGVLSKVALSKIAM